MSAQSPTPATTSARASRGLSHQARWTLGIVGLLGISVGANILLMMKAVGDPSFSVEPNYYQKAVNWDETAAAAARSEALGWQVQVQQFSTTAPGRAAELLVRVLDAAPAPLDGAEVKVLARHNARPQEPVEAALIATGPGTYRAEFLLPRAGMWQLDFEVKRAGEVFQTSLRRDVVAAAKGNTE